MHRRAIPILLLLLSCLVNTDSKRCLAQNNLVQLASATADVDSAKLAADSRKGKPLSESSWPVRVQMEQFVVYSTVSSLTLEPHLAGLRSLPGELKDELKVRISDSPIHVVVLSNRESLDQYALKILPDAPRRQALYIRHRGPGLVLTYFHRDWLQDVRHECTHALLDASNLALQVWQDEGLAEYFETVGKNRIQHAAHFKSIRKQVDYGQVVDLARLETAEVQEGLDGKGYRDSWSVVAFLLNSSSDSKTMFQTYLQEQQDKRAAGLLSHRVRSLKGDWRVQFTSFFKGDSVQ
jgi:hypothetical protein